MGTEWQSDWEHIASKCGAEIQIESLGSQGPASVGFTPGPVPRRPWEGMEQGAPKSSVAEELSRSPHWLRDSWGKGNTQELRASSLVDGPPLGIQAPGHNGYVLFINQETCLSAESMGSGISQAQCDSDLTLPGCVRLRQVT